ncbi:hypothetical protein PUNSTDRAFT_134926, partial [Punctularia strigosozonata HHB-11173 SS5]|uniref:uncharacterized protein n=1 Tax=Punctularia strigosozonata (strain HHB-11173) TaxID=741275 RepID=UPI00044173D9
DAQWQQPPLSSTSPREDADDLPRLSGVDTNVGNADVFAPRSSPLQPPLSSTSPREDADDLPRLSGVDTNVGNADVFAPRSSPLQPPPSATSPREDADDLPRLSGVDTNVGSAGVFASPSSPHERQRDPADLIPPLLHAVSQARPVVQPKVLWSGRLLSDPRLQRGLLASIQAAAQGVPSSADPNHPGFSPPFIDRSQSPDAYIGQTGSLDDEHIPLNHESDVAQWEGGADPHFFDSTGEHSGAENANAPRDTSGEDSDEYVDEEGDDDADDDDDELERDAVDEEDCAPSNARRRVPTQKQAPSQNNEGSKASSVTRTHKGESLQTSEGSPNQAGAERRADAGAAERISRSEKADAAPDPKGKGISRDPSDNEQQSASENRGLLSQRKAKAKAKTKAKTKTKAKAKAKVKAKAHVPKDDGGERGTDEDDGSSSSEETTKSKPGPLPKKYLAMIEDFIEQIDEFVEKMAILTERPAEKILKMLFGPEVVKQRAKSPWAAFSSWYAKHKPHDKENESPESFMARLQAEYHQRIGQFSGQEKVDAAQPYLDWRQEREEAYLAKLGKEGKLKREFKRAVKLAVQLAKNLWRHEGLHCFGFLIDTKGPCGFTAFGGSPPWAELRTRYGGDMWNTMANYQAAIRVLEMAMLGIGAPELPPPSLQSDVIPAAKPREGEREYLHRVFKVLFKRKCLRIPITVNMDHFPWHKLLDFMLKHEVRLINADPDFFLIYTNPSYAFKFRGNEEKAASWDHKADIPLVTRWAHSEDKEDDIVMIGDLEQVVMYTVEQTSAWHQRRYGVQGRATRNSRGRGRGKGSRAANVAPRPKAARLLPNEARDPSSNEEELYFPNDDGTHEPDQQYLVYRDEDRDTGEGAGVEKSLGDKRWGEQEDGGEQGRDAMRRIGQDKRGVVKAVEVDSDVETAVMHHQSTLQKRAYVMNENEENGRQPVTEATIAGIGVIETHASSQSEPTTGRGPITISGRPGADGRGRVTACPAKTKAAPSQKGPRGGANGR